MRLPQGRAPSQRRQRPASSTWPPRSGSPPALRHRPRQPLMGPPARMTLSSSTTTGSTAGGRPTAATMRTATSTGTTAGRRTMRVPRSGASQVGNHESGNMTHDSVPTRVADLSRYHLSLISRLSCGSAVPLFCLLDSFCVRTKPSVPCQMVDDLSSGNRESTLCLTALRRVQQRQRAVLPAVRAGRLRHSRLPRDSGVRLSGGAADVPPYIW